MVNNDIADVSNNNNIDNNNIKYRNTNDIFNMRCTYLSKFQFITLHYVLRDKTIKNVDV